MTLLLETPRLRVRAFAHDDLDALGALYADPAVTRFVCAPMDPLTAWRRAAAALAWCRDHSDPERPGVWAVEHRETGRLVGRVGLSSWTDHTTPVHELGYLIGTAWAGQGYATEAATAVRDHALSVLGLPRLVALVHPDNAASRAVLAKLGFSEEPHRRVIEGGQPRAVWHLRPGQ